jgi:hypothetical protein
MIRRSGLFGSGFLLLGLLAGPVMAQPYILTTGVGDGEVSVGVDGFGSFGINPGPNSNGGQFDPIGPTAPFFTVWESGVALRIGAAGPRAFLTSGNIGGSGSLPNPVVTGSSTSGTSTFTNSGLSFSLVQTVAPTFNGALRTGAMLTQTYTITNTTAATITFELVRLVDTERNVYVGGRFFAANRNEIIYADENPINPYVVGFTGIGGTPLASNRYDIDANPNVRTRVLAGNALLDAITGDSNSDGIIDSAGYNFNMGLRNVFTVAPGASTVYTTHTVWGTGPAPNVIFPTPPPPSAPGTPFGVTWTGSQLLRINTNPTAGTAAGTLVAPLSAGVVPAGVAFRGNTLYVYDQLADRILEVDQATAATLVSINPNITGVFGEGDIAFRSDGIGFLAPGAPAQLYRFDITGPSSTQITAALTPTMDGFTFDAAGVLYGLSEGGGGLYTINQTTGATTLVGNTGITGTFTFGGLSFDASGNLFAVVGNAGGSFLYQLNPASGAATLLGNIGFSEVSGLAFSTSLSIPPPSTPTGPEGSYKGGQGPEGPDVEEGAFGFGGRSRRPVLAGPFVLRPGTRIVLNVSHRQSAADGDAQAERGLPGWTIAIAGFALALAAVLAGGKVLSLGLS